MRFSARLFNKPGKRKARRRRGQESQRNRAGKASKSLENRERVTGRCPLSIVSDRSAIASRQSFGYGFGSFSRWSLIDCFWFDPTALGRTKTVQWSEN